MINLKAAAQSVRAKDKERGGGRKELMISFHHSVFPDTELKLSYPRPPQGQETEAGFWCVFRFLHCCLHMRTELL